MIYLRDDISYLYKTPWRPVHTDKDVFSFLFEQQHPKKYILICHQSKQVLKKNGGGGGGGDNIQKSTKYNEMGGCACKIGEYIIDHEMYNSKFSTKF